MKKVLILVIVSMIWMNTEALGFPAELVYDPFNEIQTTTTALNSAEQLYNQAKQLQYELNNLKNYDGNATQWNQILPLLQRLGDIDQQGQSISYSMSNVNQQFKKMYPGYQAEKDYDREYQAWSNTTMNTLQNTMQSNHDQSQDFVNEQTRLNELKRLSTTSSGRMQAVQTGNMIAAEEVAQTQKLRQLVMSQTNSQNAYMAYTVQKDQAQQAANNQLLKHPKAYPKYGTGKGFGSHSLPTLSN